MADEPDSNGNGKIEYLYDVKTGLPLHRPSDVAIERAEEVLFRRSFTAAKARWQAGDTTAFNTAMWLVWRRCPEAIPLELVEMAETLVTLPMTQEEKNDRSAFAMHLERYEMVTELLERHDELTQRGRIELERAEAALMAAIKAQNIVERDRLYKILSELRELAKVDWGSTLEQAQEMVAEALTKAGPRPVKPRAVRASYDLIRAAGGAKATYESFLEEQERRWGLRRRRGQPRDESED
jgi:hypothetical protein